MKIVSLGLALLMSLALVGKVFAADEEKAPGGREGRRPGAEGFNFLRGLKLTDEQKAKVEAIDKEFAPKRKALWDKSEGILTADQKKAREEAVKKAKEANKNPREVMEAAREAVKLTDEQKKQRAENRKETEALNKEYMEKINPLLTPEQQAKLKERRENRRERRPEVN
jgi:periplasmic protein CpxP/Spy